MAEVPTLAANAAEMRRRAQEAAEAAKRQVVDEGETRSVMTAFLVYMDGEGNFVMEPNYAARNIVPDRPPSRDEVKAACSVIMHRLSAGETAVEAANLVLNNMPAVFQQLFQVAAPGQPN